ncbi:hypothetical protein [Coleofasciculus sp. G2-EDA-02]|uniref:hypothetical protein n=1 Tax=Coleofasciculus sp. G2-EDA-02 TaxID=3069529 RepID=UPI0032F127E4
MTPTQSADATTEKTAQQDTFRTPEYFWFHPDTLEFQSKRGHHDPSTFAVEAIF